MSFNMTHNILISLLVFEYIRHYTLVYCCLCYLCYMSGGRGGILGGTLVPRCVLEIVSFSVVDLGNYDNG